MCPSSASELGRWGFVLGSLSRPYPLEPPGDFAAGTLSSEETRDGET